MQSEDWKTSDLTLTQILFLIKSLCFTCFWISFFFAMSVHDDGNSRNTRHAHILLSLRFYYLIRFKINIMT